MYYDRQVIRTTGEALASLLYLGSTSVYHNISDLSICTWIIQSTLAISTSVISNNRFSRSKILVPILT